MTATALDKTASIYAVEPTGETDRLKATSIAEAKIGEYSILGQMKVGGASCLFGYHPARETVDFYWLRRDGAWLVPADKSPVVGKDKDAIVPFVLGNLPYLTTYAAPKGIFETYAVAPDLSVSKPYKFYRNHELAISKNFTTVKSFVQISQVIFLGYNLETGYVALYSAAVTPQSEADGQPPILMLPVWAHPWSPGWVHFAFFQLGGENFFFKINVANRDKVNVNIDHILDSLDSTIEVGSHLPLAEALDISSVEPFTLGHGDPYFVTYIAKNGTTKLNSFHNDCRGWTTVAEFDAPAGAHAAVPIVGDDGKQYLIFA